MSDPTDVGSQKPHTGKRKRTFRRPKLDPASPRAAAVARRVLILKKDSPSMVKNYLRAVNCEGGAKSAIKAFCLMCIPNDRQAIATCTSLACPLYGYRPFQHKLDKVEVDPSDKEFEIPGVDEV